MKFVVRRKGVPLLIAVAGLAILPLEGATATPPAPAPAVSNVSLRHLAVNHTVRSLAAIAASSSVSGAAATSEGSLNDARQAPLRGRGGYRRAPGAAGLNAAAVAPLQVPVVPPTPVTGAPLAVNGFDGLNNYQQRYEATPTGTQFTVTPPDQGLCVGNGFVVESVNDAIRVYSKAGVPATAPVGLNAFYGYPPAVIRGTKPQYGPSLTDPTCYFDPQYSRWFHVVLTLDTNPATGALVGSNHLDIAVSTSDSPLGEWAVYSIPVQNDGTQGTPRHTDCPCIGDYPHIGADKYGFYITTNEYPFGTGPGVFGNNYNGAQVYALSKSQLVHDSDTVSMEQFSGLALSNGTPSFTLWPSEVPGTAYDTRDKGTEWFSQSTSAFQETNNPAGMSNNIAVWRMTNTKSLDSHDPAPQLVSKVLPSEVYGVPPPAEQKVGPVPLRDCLLTTCLPGLGPSRSEVQGPLDSNDSRMQSAWLAGGQLYTALDTIAQVNGRDQAGVAYFIVDVAGPFDSTAVSKQGYAAVAGNIMYPSIATRADGTGAMALSLAGDLYYPSAAYMAIGPNGLIGSVNVAEAGAGPDDEFCQYVFFNCAGTTTPTIRPRWGDYGAAAIDGTQVWIASEFIDQSCTIDQYRADPRCGQTRAPISNWATRITQVTP